MSKNDSLTFDGDDKLNLKSLSGKFEKFLLIDHNFVDGSLVVSLNALFGSGKTTFLTMWKNDLDHRRQTDTSLPRAIMLNAWESDYCGDPLLALVTELIKATRSDDAKKSSSDTKRLCDAAKDVAWFATGLANNLVSHWTGFDPVAAGQLAESKKDARHPVKPDFVALYEKRTEALENLKNTLKEIFGGESPKAFVFVDELDRCRPDYAISYLETIKHVFDVHGLVFVLAVDSDQLECSARALFGQALNFPEYFRKFVQRTLILPQPDETGLKNLARHYVSSYLEKEGKRISAMDFTRDRVENIVDLISALRMTPRQIQESFRIIGHTVAGNEASKGKLYWCAGVGVIFMSVLRVARPETYHSIGRDQQRLLEVGHFLVKLLDRQEVSWWFSVYLAGFVGIGGSQTALDYERVFKELGFSSIERPFDLQRDLGQFIAGWGNPHSNQFINIYEKVETVSAY